jgi:hypothetical protein
VTFKPRHCEERSDAAIYALELPPTGLLRFARNDACCADPAAPFRLSEAPAFAGVTVIAHA